MHPDKARQRHDSHKGPTYVSLVQSMGMYFEEMPLLFECAFTKLCESAKTGAGVPHEHYGPFHR